MVRKCGKPAKIMMKEMSLKNYKITDENGNEKGECVKVYAIDDSSFSEEKKFV